MREHIRRRALLALVSVWTSSCVSTTPATPVRSQEKSSAQPGTLTPYGGPGGYTNLVFGDSFGSSKPPPATTSVSQFHTGARGDVDPSEMQYGPTATGWDLWMYFYTEPVPKVSGPFANIAMMPDHLEIYPAANGAGFISSHFEDLPAPGHRLYYEIRAATGRGGIGANPGKTLSAWPAFWLYAGNEQKKDPQTGQDVSAAVNKQSELDIMETSVNPPTTEVEPAPNYSYFGTSTHTTGAAMVEAVNIRTPGVDITTSYNIYGCEVANDVGRNPPPGNNISWTMYFNGKKVASSTKLLHWTSSNPSLFLGWNPASSPYSPAVMKVDYVRVWSK